MAENTAGVRMRILMLWRELTPSARIDMVDLLNSEFCLWCGEAAHKNVFPCPNVQITAEEAPFPVQPRP